MHNGRCRHYWVLGATTLEGTPARCNQCDEYKLFRTKPLPWETAAEVPQRPGGVQRSHERGGFGDAPFNLRSLPSQTERLPF